MANQRESASSSCRGSARPPTCWSRKRGPPGCWLVGSGGRGGFAGLLLGSVSQQAVQARCPVVVTPSNPDA
ncbi:MAG: universal stress protein [Egibacteraceae bacterium]